MKAFIIMFNRLTWPKAMAEFLGDHDIEVILVDNGSTYPPLLEWYEDCPHRVHRLTKEHNHKSLWASGLINEYPDEHYIVSDHDLDLSDVPGDFVDKLFGGLNGNIWATKAGLSLKIDDLPQNDYTAGVVAWESKWWQRPQDANGFYFADVDTTFALYDAGRMKAATDAQFFQAVRSPKPYEARHLPWYNTPDNLSEEERYYMANIGNVGFWTHEFKRQHHD